MLPIGTSLGQLQIFEIYEFYNMPVLFACKNQADSIYLAVWLDETETEDSWLYVTISPRRFAKIRAGQIDLHDAFAQPEDAVVLQVSVPKDTHVKAQVESIPAIELDASWPPLAGEFLDIPAALPHVLWDGVDQRNPVIADYPTYITPEPWYRQLAISTLSMPPNISHSP